MFLRYFTNVQLVRCHLTHLQVAETVGRMNSGKSQRSVARYFNVAPSVINCACNRYWTEATVNAKPGQGRPRSSNARQARYIVSYAFGNRRSTAKGIQIHVKRAAQVRLSTSTIRNLLNSQYLNARRPASGLILTRAHHGTRRNFARIPMNWRLERWRHRMLSNELTSHLSTCDRRIRV